MFNNIYKRIYKKIKEYDAIVIARHIGPDPDALASSLALKDIILNTFPNKKVLTIGVSVSKFKYFGNMDKLDIDTKEALLIITDTPNLKRVDGTNPINYKYSIKIDHHPIDDLVTDLSLVDTTSSSASQLVLELVNNTKLKITKEAAEKLYLGIVSDTNRFMHYYTSSKTFKLVAKLIEDTKIDITTLYPKLYLESINNKKIENYILSNMIISENGLGYLIIEDNTLKEFGIDAPTARNTVNNFNYIKELLVWGIFTQDKDSEKLHGSLRSRGPIINDIASKYSGGGHIYACGAHPNKNELQNLIDDLEEICQNYQINKD